MTDEIKEARKQGQNEAWELARKLVTGKSYTTEELDEIFNTFEYSTILEKNTYAEAAEKVSTWENKKLPKVGQIWRDEQDGTCRLVLSIRNCEGVSVSTLAQKGIVAFWNIDYFVSTHKCTKGSIPVSNWIEMLQKFSREREKEENGTNC